MYYPNAPKFILALIDIAGERRWTWNVLKLTQHRHGVLGELGESTDWTWNVLKLTQKRDGVFRRPIIRRTHHLELEL